VLMLSMASRLGTALSWPALLAALAICLNVYWVALWWRGRQTN
jgi:ATP synthase protein I